MPRFCTAGLLSIPDYNTSLLRSQPSLLPSTRSSTLTSTFNTCMLTQTDCNDVIEFASISICLPISISRSCIQICLPLLLSVRLCIFTRSALISFLFHHWIYVCVRVFFPQCASLSHSPCQGLPGDNKLLAICVSYLYQKHILGRTFLLLE